MFHQSRRLLLSMLAYGVALGCGPVGEPNGASDAATPGEGTDTAAEEAAGRDGGALTDSTTIEGLTLEIERSTPEQIAVHLPVMGALSPQSHVTVRYRKAADGEWRIGHPLLRIHPEWIAAGAPKAPVDAFAGTIFDLTPGTPYEVELTLEEPGKDKRMLGVRISTRALPPPAPSPTVTEASASGLQAKLAALKAGDVLELANGTYDVGGLVLASSGTADKPIYIRGKSREGVVLRSKTSRVLQIQGAAHVVLENLTMEGSGVDSGTAASSVAVSFWDGASQEDITFRNLDIRGVDQGIVATGPVRGVLVYNSVLRGNNLWNKDFIQTNLTWNDDGIRLPGEGNCAFENTLHGFGDSFAVNNGAHSSAVYYYRNRITMTGDDAFEADYATRNIGFYDNYITNSATFLSLDPLWGGPLYCFRNVSINAMRGPFKLNDTNAGFLIYNNTIVRTDGTTGWGWVQFNNGSLRSWSYRNNIVIYRGAGNLLAIESGGNDPMDLTHNAWFPDKSVWWSSSGGSFTSIAAARSGLPPTTPMFGGSKTRHEGDVIIESEPFATRIALGPDHLTEITASTVPSLGPSASAKYAGATIANITDGFAGAAPDMGAIVEGRPVPKWGAVRP